MLLTVEINNEYRNVLTDNEASVLRTITDLKASIKEHKKMLQTCSYETHKNVLSMINRMTASLELLEGLTNNEEAEL